ncbi:MAG: UDP-N-acetylmuramoyl-L-alanyl-D-glutamate--2,6-diaminopimelate ligase [bacterium]
MRLSSLLKNLDCKNEIRAGDLEVEGIAYDSRRVEGGFLFVAIPGFKLDGHDFIPQAVEKGAVAVVSERDVPLPPGVVAIKVESSRRALSTLACNFYDHPTRSLVTIGVTGTNGKTTTVHYIESILKAAGYNVGMLGTVVYRWDGKSTDAPNTTPESLDLQRILREMVEDGCACVVMEVSSHALQLGRVDGCLFDVAVFTNLTREHLELHRDLETYRDVKAKLFDMLKPQGIAVINADDDSGRYIIEKIGGVRDVRAYSYAEIGNVRRRGYFTDFEYKGFSISLKMPGRYNIYNALAAIRTAESLGIPPECIKVGIEGTYVPGRFEIIPSDRGFDVIVDYAHTFDGIEKVLGAIRECSRGRIIAVFGCSGDRDVGQRPIMGETLARFSDFLIITTDDPRGEEPRKLAMQIEVGVERSAYRNRERKIILNRREAIEFAIRSAGPGDVVAILGRGHEKYQIIEGGNIPFDDREVTRGILRSM